MRARIASHVPVFYTSELCNIGIII